MFRNLDIFIKFTSNLVMSFFFERGFFPLGVNLIYACNGKKSFWFLQCAWVIFFSLFDILLLAKTFIFSKHNVLILCRPGITHNMLFAINFLCLISVSCIMCAAIIKDFCFRIYFHNLLPPNTIANIYKPKLWQVLLGFIFLKCI